MADDVEVVLAFTVTGAVVDSVPVTTWSYSQSVSWSDPGSMSVTVPLTGRDAASRAVVEALRSVRRAPWSLSMVLVKDGRAVYAGPAVTIGWDADGLTVGCASIPALLERRLLVAGGWFATPWRYEANLHFELSTRDLAIALIRQGITGHGRGLPLTLPDGPPKSGPPVDYLGADLGTINERVKAVVDRDDGPDVMIRPELAHRTGMLRWVVKVGQPRLGATTSQTTFDLPGSVLSLSGDIDASESVSTGYVLGDSSGTSRLIGVAQVDRGDPHPALERADRTSVSERRQEQLDALARSYVSDFSAPTETWSMTVDPNQVPLYGQEWDLGDPITVSVADHPWLEDGDYLRRVIGVQVDQDSLQVDTTSVREGLG